MVSVVPSAICLSVLSFNLTLKNILPHLRSGSMFSFIPQVLYQDCFFLITTNTTAPITTTATITITITTALLPPDSAGASA